jgi:hypothetical protein
VLRLEVVGSAIQPFHPTRDVRRLIRCAVEDVPGEPDAHRSDQYKQESCSLGMTLEKQERLNNSSVRTTHEEARKVLQHAIMEQFEAVIWGSYRQDAKVAKKQGNAHGIPSWNSGTVTKFVRLYSSSAVTSLTNLVTVPELTSGTNCRSNYFALRR